MYLSHSSSFLTGVSILFLSCTQLKIKTKYIMPCNWNIHNSLCKIAFHLAKNREYCSLGKLLLLFLAFQFFISSLAQMVERWSFELFVSNHSLQLKGNSARFSSNGYCMLFESHCWILWYNLESLYYKGVVANGLNRVISW